MKLSFHQHIALFWMIGAPVPSRAEDRSPRPDAAVMAWGVAIVHDPSPLVAAAVHHSGARRGRTMSSSGSARRLPERSLLPYQTAFDDTCPRDALYVWRIIWTVGRVDGCDRRTRLPTTDGQLDALVVFRPGIR
jgi:hypothetical protein